MRSFGRGVAGALLFMLASCSTPADQVKKDPSPETQPGGLTPPKFDGDVPPGAAFAPGSGNNAPGQFDFYVLSLSWSPQHCATRGKQLPPDDPQCGGSAAYGFIVHGLWPQFQQGYPESCAPPGDLDPALIKRILRIMPSEKLIRHEWEKHGTCSGLPADQYFAQAEALMGGLKFPDRFTAPKEVISTSVAALRQDLAAANPNLPKDGASVAIVCQGEYLRELRLCYSKDFKPQACTGEVRDTCPANFSARPLISRR